MNLSGKIFNIDMPLDTLCEQLNPDEFFRANRQTILGVRSIRKIEPYFGGKIVVSTQPQSPTQITVSREKVALFKAWLNY